MGNERITLLSSREIEKMRRAGALAAELLDYLVLLRFVPVLTK